MFAPREQLLQVEPDGRSFRAQETLPDAPKLVVIGVRACDLAALAVPDRVFLEGRYPDAHYAARRRRLFLDAVTCTRSASTCFSVSMATGPEATQGFDLALTEQEQGFLARAGSAEGEEVLQALPLAPASAEALARERTSLEACAAGCSEGSKPRTCRRCSIATSSTRAGRTWKRAACPAGTAPWCVSHVFLSRRARWTPPRRTGRSGCALRSVREWDSCVNRDHAQVYGVNFRPQIQDRYRQWLVHKLASWIDQFGTSGCVGCGRCITWCPVGIDLTVEVRALREPGA